MANHLTTDLKNAYLQLIQLSGSVERMIADATNALLSHDCQLARQIIADDSDIDRREVQIEENCLTLLALHHPVAADLRRITMMLKINNELEQMADLACNIAQRVESLADDERYLIPQQIAPLAGMVSNMVRNSMDAFINSDADMAYGVLAADDDVDRVNAEVIETIEQSIVKDASQIRDAMLCFSASRHLEQIADHATSIAEDVIYMVSGDIVRHRRTLTQETSNAQK